MPDSAGAAASQGARGGGPGSGRGGARLRPARGGRRPSPAVKAAVGLAGDEDFGVHFVRRLRLVLVAALVSSACSTGRCGAGFGRGG